MAAGWYPVELTNYLLQGTPETGGYCALVSGASGIPKPPTVSGVFLFVKNGIN